MALKEWLEKYYPLPVSGISDEDRLDLEFCLGQSVLKWRGLQGNVLTEHGLRHIKFNNAIEDELGNRFDNMGLSCHLCSFCSKQLSIFDNLSDDPEYAPVFSNSTNELTEEIDMCVFCPIYNSNQPVCSAQGSGFREWGNGHGDLTSGRFVLATLLRAEAHIIRFPDARAKCFAENWFKKVETKELEVIVQIKLIGKSKEDANVVAQELLHYLNRNRNRADDVALMADSEEFKMSDLSVSTINLISVKPRNNDLEKGD